MMTPLDYYHHQCSQGLVQADPQQVAALSQMQTVYLHLLRAYRKRSRFIACFRQAECVTGIYLWGGVGIGKTFLMDCFYHCIPFTEKKRMHFHQFMRFIHHELKKHQGKKNPLELIAKALAKKTFLLCLDEMLVSDIADAMLLARLLKSLFAEGICLIVTSNVVPDDLYKNGLQRALFLPAIKLLKQFTHVVSMTTEIDYRLQHLKNAGVFFTPDDAIAKENMEKCFMLLAQGLPIQHQPIEICDRYIPIVKQAGDMVWFNFKDICHPPRSQHDYLSIAEKYRTVFISHVPLIPPEAKDVICLFIRLVDVFYDARVRLVFSAQSEIPDIYTQGQMQFDFARTRSRLIEMQSQDYF